jgi:hypothetical protein
MPLLRFFLAAAALLLAATTAIAQSAPTPQKPAPTKPLVEKTGPNTFVVSGLRVDTARREVVADGTINDVTVLEFVANTRKGMKAYESALTIDTDAISYNAALLLIGLDPARAKVPQHHFDPNPPQGDPVEILVEWTANGTQKRAAIEELLYDSRTKSTLPPGPWVYTGSTFLVNDGKPLFLSESDGVLIGFVHSPAPLIENPRAGAVDGYGSVVLNPNLGLTPGLAVKLTVRALPRR